MKPIIYQLFPRLFTNTCTNRIQNGTIEQNGVGKMNDINDNVLQSIKDLGVTHIWYTGVIEHATKTNYKSFGIKPDNPYVVKGNAGSPYAIKDYYDIDPDIAVNIPNRIIEFEALVKRTHDNGMKVIIDFVPNHVAREYYSDVKPIGVTDFGQNDNSNMMFSPTNNYYYIPRQAFSPQFDLGTGNDTYFEFPAKATGNDCFSAFPSTNDWYETVKLNYGVDYGNGTHHFTPIPDTWCKMVDILRYWASKGVDAFRCDMVFMVPVEFWGWAIPIIKGKYPDIKFIAEIYDVNLYRNYIFSGHFDYLYDKVTLYDTLRGVQCCNISAASITNCWQTVNGINNHMLNFLENHDEQRFASSQYAGNAEIVTPSLVVSATINQSPMMIYQGQELGERGEDNEGFSGYDGRTTIFDYWSMTTVCRWYNNGKCNEQLLTDSEIKLRNLYKRILTLCNQEKAISKGAFFDLMYVNYNNVNPHRHYTYLRHYENETLLIAVNFSADKAEININIPLHAFEHLNIRQGEYQCTELLSGKKRNKCFTENAPFHCIIEAFGAVIWKITEKT